MTDRERALAIADAFRTLQAKEIAYRTLISRFRLNGEPVHEGWIAQDVQQDLAPASPFGQALSSFGLRLESTNQSEVLEALYQELFEPPE